MPNAQFQDIETRLSRLLSNSGVSDFTPAERSQVINDVIRIDLMQFFDGRWPQFLTYTDLVFTSGEATLPDDYLQEHRLYLANTDGTVSKEYHKSNNDMFINGQEFTYEINPTDANIKIYSADSTTLRFWYWKTPITADITTGDTGFDYRYIIPIAQLAAATIIEYKMPDSPRIISYLYGAGRTERNPSPVSAYGRLNKLFAQEKKKYKEKIRHINSIYDGNGKHYHQPFYSYRGINNFSK